MLDTLESVHRRALARRGRRAQLTESPLLWTVRRFWPSNGVNDDGDVVYVEPPRDIIAAIRSGDCVGEIDVRVNHGRWVADCPTDGCVGAALASESDHRFFCIICRAGVYAVRWPSDDDRARIEAAMAPRPVENRNWTAGDAVDEEEQMSSAWVLFGVLAGAGR